MSEKELRRVEVLARVVSGELRLGDATVLLQVSYRQAKRLARRYRQGGPAALRPGRAGRLSNPGTPPQRRQQVLALGREKYFRSAEGRFCPPLEAGHFAGEDALRVDPATPGRLMLG